MILKLFKCKKAKPAGEQLEPKKEEDSYPLSWTLRDLIDCADVSVKLGRPLVVKWGDSGDSVEVTIKLDDNINIVVVYDRSYPVDILLKFTYKNKTYTIGNWVKLFNNRLENYDKKFVPFVDKFVKMLINECKQIKEDERQEAILAFTKVVNQLENKII
jgi:hypothetical protein